MKDKDIDAVSVCLPNFLHADVAISALENNKHVLCEKPLASSIKDAEKIVKASDKSKKKFMVAMKFRFTPEAQYIINEFNAGNFGNVYYGYTHYLRPVGGIPLGVGNWFINKSKSGGGTLIDNGVHLLDLNWYLMGCPKPISVYGSTYAKFGPKIDSIKEDFDVEDFGCGLIKFENGETIYLDNAWAVTVENEIIGLRTCGTKGGATMWPFSIINLKDNKCELEKPDLSKNTYKTQFDYFVESIINDTQPISTAKQAYEVLLMLNGIYKSSKIGKSIRI